MAKIQQSLNMTSLDTASINELARILKSLLGDVESLAASLNQLISDYNANTNISDDTTATAVTPSTSE